MDNGFWVRLIGTVASGQKATLSQPVTPVLLAVPSCRRSPTVSLRARSLGPHKLGGSASRSKLVALRRSAATRGSLLTAPPNLLPSFLYYVLRCDRESCSVRRANTQLNFVCRPATFPMAPPFLFYYGGDFIVGFPSPAHPLWRAGRREPSRLFPSTSFAHAATGSLP